MRSLRTTTTSVNRDDAKIRRFHHHTRRARRSELFVTYVPSSPSASQLSTKGSVQTGFSVQFLRRLNHLDSICRCVKTKRLAQCLVREMQSGKFFHLWLWPNGTGLPFINTSDQKKNLSSSIFLILEFRRFLSKSRFAGFLASCFFYLLFFVIFNCFASFARPLPWGRHHHRRAELIRENIGKHIILLPCIGWFTKHTGFNESSKEAFAGGLDTHEHFTTQRKKVSKI